MNLTTQWFTIFTMVCSGFLIGILLDIYRVLKARFRLQGWTISLVDLLYWVVSAGLVFNILYFSNWGDFRFYIFVAILVGFGVYLRWYSKKVSQLVAEAVRVVERVILYIMEVIQRVIMRPVIRLWSVCIRLYHILKKVLSRVFPVLVQPIKWVATSIWKVISSYCKPYFSFLTSFWFWNKKNKGDD